MQNAASITRPEQLDRLIAHFTTIGHGYQAEVVRAARSGRINLVWPERHGNPSIGTLKRSARPVLVLLGDDDYATTGPAGWRAVPKLLRWARGAMIHGTGADVATYSMAVEMAVAAKRFLLIETSSDASTAWADALSGAAIPYLALRPPEGVHPLPRDRSAMQ